MGAHRLLTDLYQDGAAYRIVDPGNKGTFVVDRQFAVCEIVTTGEETRTLGVPKFTGQVFGLAFKTDGGDCVITCATGINQTGNTTITLNDAADLVVLYATRTGDNLRWRVIANDGATLA